MRNTTKEVITIGQYSDKYEQKKYKEALRHIKAAGENGIHYTKLLEKVAFDGVELDSLLYYMMLEADIYEPEASVYVSVDFGYQF
jgi:hypothetical protein